MSIGKQVLSGMALLAIAMVAAAQAPPAQSQTPPPGRAAPPRGGGGGFANAFPQHDQADQATIDRGKALYGDQ